MIRFFSRKYPLQYINIRVILLISIGIGMFIYIFKPFGFVNYQHNQELAAFGFLAVTLFSLLLLNLYKKNLGQKVSKWTILMEILFLFLVLFFISAGNYVLMSFLIENFNLSIWNFLHTILLTISIGVLPIGFITVLRYNHFKNTQMGKLIQDGNPELKSDSAQEEIVELVSLNKTDEAIKISKKKFLFVESIKNNVHIYYYKGDEVKTSSIRNTLKNIESQLEGKEFFRCHRSFIVNTNNIKTAKGNSNSYKIYFKNYDHFVPVSRSYTKTFQELL